MTKNVLMAVLFHETHTFLQQKTGMDQFRQNGINIGDEILKNNIGNGSPTDGFLDYAEAKNWNVIPTIQMAASPSGMVDDEAIEYFKRHFFDVLISEYENIDSIYLVLHGAMVSEAIDDVEGDLLFEIDDFLMGKKLNIPVVAVIDLHANVSKKMTDHSACLFSYQKNPHSDARDAAINAAKLLDQLMDDAKVSQIHLGSSYVIPPTGQATANDPLKSTLARAREIEKADPDILCINVMGGYAYADIADCGFSLNCTARGDTRKAHGYLEELLQIFESHLDQAYPLEASLETVLSDIDQTKSGPGPILLIEPSDNIGGGTPGDGTGILEPLLVSGRKNIVAIINDPEAATICHDHALGDTVELMIGAKTDAHHGKPVKFKGTIEHLSDGKFILEDKNSHLASMVGNNIEMGLCAVVKNERATILLSSHKTPPMDLGQLHSQNIMPEQAELVIIKAAVSHKDAYDPIARTSYYVDSPGLCSSNLKRFPYKKLKNKKISLN